MLALVLRASGTAQRRAYSSSLHWSLRAGIELVVTVGTVVGFPSSLGADEPLVAPAPRRFVGSAACAPCHEDQYARFSAQALKRRSFVAVEKMQRHLTADEVRGCYACHTTGYGQPGGFVSKAETPELAACGCEVCHGPGAAHAASSARGDIVRRPAQAICDSCHTESRIRAFNYRPLISAGAH